MPISIPTYSSIVQHFQSTETIARKAQESGDPARIQSALIRIKNKRDTLRESLDETYKRMADAADAFESKLGVSPIDYTPSPIRPNSRNREKVGLNNLHATWKDKADKCERLSRKVKKLDNLIENLDLSLSVGPAQAAPLSEKSGQSAVNPTEPRTVGLAEPGSSDA